jgi:hypothetical protein
MVSGYGNGNGGEDGDAMYLWDELPHFTWDNYFSGDQIFDYMGNLRFGALMMCPQDHLPSGILERHMSKKDGHCRKVKGCQVQQADCFS